MSRLNTISNKRLAKNTLLLYVRMLITMVIGLFSVRIILRALGETDYGIYNVVGGVITMLAFLNNTLSSTTQRFLSYEMGQENSKYREIFRTSISLYLLFCVVLIVFGETVGLWFVNHKLTIPVERMFAANCVYQFSIISFVFTVLSAPYNAAVIAHERMSFFAYVSIVDALCKLLMCYALLYVSSDKLIVYGALMAMMSVSVFVLYVIYCNVQKLECTFKWLLQKEYISKIATFAGWNSFGALANIFRAQGINFLLNIFFGPLANTARGIAYQAETALLTLVQNFYIAVRPQAIKSYSEGNVLQTINLILFSTKIGYVIMLLLFSITVFEAPFIFNLWLGNTSDLMIIYFRIIMVSVLFDALVTPLTMLVHANGNVKNYQLCSGLLTASSLLFAYLFLKVSDDMVMPMLAVPLVSVLLLINVVFQVNKLIHFPLYEYMRLLFRLFIATVLVCLSIIALQQFENEGLLGFLFTSIISILLTTTTFVLFILSKEEKQKLIYILRSKFSKEKNRNI